MNAKTRCIERLVRTLVTNYLEQVFGSQVNMSMLQQLRCHCLCLARLKKPGGKDSRAPNYSVLNCSIRLPRNAMEASQFDQ